MLKEITYILSENTKDYRNFFKEINDNLLDVTTYNNKENILKDMDRVINNSSFSDDGLLIIFCEYPFLNYIDEYLENNLNPLNYILVSFNWEDSPLVSNYKCIFESINTNSINFDFKFFYNKLKGEIANKNRISLLQSEIREYYDIGKSLSSERDTIKLFEKIINSSIKLTNSDAGSLYLVVDKKTEDWSSIKNSNYRNKMLRFVIAKNNSIDTDLEASNTEISMDSIYGYTAITGKSIKIDDAYNIDPFLKYKHNQNFDVRNGYRTKSILSIPMMDNENNITGVIQLINKKKASNGKIDYRDDSFLKKIIPYDYSDEMIMNSLASQAAVILENNILYTKMKKLLNDYKVQNTHLEFLSKKILKSNEDERKRIAREIHDGPAQYSSNSLLRLEICKKYLQKGVYDNLGSELKNLEESLRESIKEIRTIIYDLKPSYIDDGLIASIKNHCETFEIRRGLKINLGIKGDDENIEDYMISAIYRIVQESLTNVYKHAEAKEVNIIVLIDEDFLLLSIKDDGVGFDASSIGNKKTTKGGFGLEGIRERTELLRGNLTINSKEGEGTEITIKIPLN